MNDDELDRLLNTWTAPAPTVSMRKGLRSKLPHREPRISARPLRWMVAIAVISVTLAVGATQISSNFLDSQLARVIQPVYDRYADVVPRGIWDLIGLDVLEETRIVARIRQSNPRVYVNGNFTAAPQYGPAATINVQVPGEGVYSITTHRGGVKGWVQAGRIHGDTIEFEAGRNQVRIECDKPVVGSDRPVFIRHRS